MERLQKVISNYGYTSRRNAEKLILDGKVLVNGKIINILGAKVSEKDEIIINGEALKKDEKVYYLLNKPRSVLCTTKDDRNRQTVVDIISAPQRIYPVGRLDYDTTGLLLLTNDGDFSNILTHPKNEIEKVYIAKIKGILSLDASRKLKKGLILDGIKLSPAKVKVKRQDKKDNTSIIEIIIHEGKNHQVKKMFESLGYEVLKLKRERVAFLTLDNLKSGDFRKLNPKEVKKIYALQKNS